MNTLINRKPAVHNTVITTSLSKELFINPRANEQLKNTPVVDALKCHNGVCQTSWKPAKPLK